MTKPRTKANPTPFEKMRELTRRLVQVPKSEIRKLRPKKKVKR
jgi:hypothetical protein